ncbi:hypothetical protein V6Z79_009442, partial [Aspergillus fumigatus]
VSSPARSLCFAFHRQIDDRLFNTTWTCRARSTQTRRRSKLLDPHHRCPHASHRRMPSLSCYDRKTPKGNMVPDLYFLGIVDVLRVYLSMTETTTLSWVGTLCFAPR